MEILTCGLDTGSASTLSRDVLNCMSFPKMEASAKFDLIVNSPFMSKTHYHLLEMIEINRIYIFICT